MNAHTKALKIATEANAPHNVASIQRQIERNAAFDAAMRAATGIEDARLVAAHRAALSDAQQRLIDVKASTRVLNDEQRVRLAIYLIDGVDRIGADLRVEAENVLADILSGVRHD